MAVMVCTKCGLADDSPKPLRCSKCGGRDFYASTPSAFGPSKKISPAAESSSVATTPAEASPPVSNVTLFDKYGGVPTISKIVRAFHKEIMARAHLASYFEGVDMAQLAEHTVKYIAFVWASQLKFTQAVTCTQRMPNTISTACTLMKWPMCSKTFWCSRAWIKLTSTSSCEELKVCVK